jgi:MGT family glycosyltransferase
MHYGSGVATVAMPHVGLGGHLIPAARFGEVLCRQGHRVIAWAPERCRRLIEPTGAEFRPHEPADTRQPFPNLVEFAAALAEGSDRCLGSLIEQLLAEDVDLVVHDVHVPWARLAADFLGLPRIVCNPLFPAPDWLAARGAFLAKERSAATPIARVQRARIAIAGRWGVDLGDWWETMHSQGELVASFTTEEILAGVPVPDRWTCVGPLRTNPATARARPERPLVYVAFGTFFNGMVGLFRLALEALADEPVDVLISTGGGPVTRDELGPLPANAVVEDFVNSVEVLAEAAVHVTHGGGSSVHESFLTGTPMVCLPLGSDQHAWAKVAQRLGAARIVEQSPWAIRRAVAELLADDAYRDRAGRLGEHLAQYDGPTRIAGLVEACLVAPAAAPG